jgi:hypothetical protein
MGHKPRDDDVLVQAASDEFWEFNECSHQVTQSQHTRSGLKCIAFYRTSPTCAVTYYAHVREEERDAYPRETFREYPNLMKSVEKRYGNGKRRHVLYKMGPLIPLRPPSGICKATDERPIRSKKWTTLARLLRARTLSDL